MQTVKKPVIGAILPYYGSKRTLAKTIVRQLGPHRCYWSLFCGSLAVELTKPPVCMETINDLHGDAINLSRVIRDEKMGSQLYGLLTRTLPAKPLFMDSLAILNQSSPPLNDEPPDLSRAYHYFVFSWLGLNGMCGMERPCNSFGVRYTSTGQTTANRFRSVVSSIPDWHYRLRNFVILSECGIKLAERIEDRDGTVIYADPPYIEKSRKYHHDFTAADHERLADALRRFRKTRVVVSYYAHELIDSLYPGWTRVDVSQTKKMANTNRSNPKEPVISPEILLINGPQISTEDSA